MSGRVPAGLLGAMLLLLAGAALGAGPVDVYDFDDPAQEARYRALIDEFRCPKCLNTNLSGSDAPIAKDLRGTVHRLVSEGRSNAEIRDFLQARYGDFVLYDPPFKPSTYLLWLTPAALVMLAAWLLWRLLRQPPPAPLNEAERQRLQVLLDGDDGRG